MTKQELQDKARFLINKLNDNNDLLIAIASYLCNKNIKSARILSYGISMKNKGYIIIKLLTDSGIIIIKFKF